MSRFQLKITHHIKKQKNLHLNEKRQSTDTNIRMTEFLELSEKKFETVILKNPVTSDNKHTWNIEK